MAESNRNWGGKPAAPAQTRPEAILRAFDARHPGGLWRFFERCRTDRNWPAWCYVPVGAGQVYMANEARVPLYDADKMRDLQGDPSLLLPSYDAGIAATMAAWRMGRGIYRYDPDFAAALTATPLTGDLPVDVLYHLPEWAVYVEMERPPVIGFFASLEWDINREEAELRLYFDVGDLYPTLVALHLSASSVADMLRLQRERVRDNAAKLGLDTAVLDAAYGADATMRGIIQDALAPALNLLIYLCSPEAEYRGGERPKRPEPVTTKRGLRMFPAAHARIWRLGEALGERLRKAATASMQTSDERNAPRPHLRRAHWHTYRVGKAREGYRVRWLHPILVGYGNADDDEEA